MPSKGCRFSRSELRILCRVRRPLRTFYRSIYGLDCHQKTWQKDAFHAPQGALLYRKQLFTLLLMLLRKNGNTQIRKPICFDWETIVCFVQYNVYSVICVNWSLWLENWAAKASSIFNCFTQQRGAIKQAFGAKCKYSGQAKHSDASSSIEFRLNLLTLGNYNPKCWVVMMFVLSRLLQQQ